MIKEKKRSAQHLPGIELLHHADEHVFETVHVPLFPVYQEGNDERYDQNGNN